MERPLPVPRAGEPLDEPGQVRRGDGPLKRIYFLVAVAVLQIIAGSLLLVGAAQPVRISPNVVVLSGEYYHVEFAILGTGQMSGNLSNFRVGPSTSSFSMTPATRRSAMARIRCLPSSKRVERTSPSIWVLLAQETITS